MSNLKDKRLVLGVTGSIAAYKAADLVSRLVTRYSVSLVHDRAGRVRSRALLRSAGELARSAGAARSLVGPGPGQPRSRIRRGSGTQRARMGVA